MTCNYSADFSSEYIARLHAKHTREHPDAPWRQVGGDGAASVAGALFGHWEWGSYEMVEIYAVDTPNRGPTKLPNYLVYVASYLPFEAEGREAEEAQACCGVTDDFEWTLEATFEAMFTAGCGVDKDLRYDGVEGFDTLRAAMEDRGIPREALWDPDEYDAPAPDADTGAGDEA